MTGIVTLPLVPLRISNSEQSEMTSQLLFGEHVEILETREPWLLVRNCNDNFCGWVDRKMLTLLTKQKVLVEITPHCVSVPLLTCRNSENQNIFIPGGSLLPRFSSGKSQIGNEVFSVDSKLEYFSETVDGDKLCELAKQYLNAPQLSGGKTIMGIDCSGLVQVVFSIGGILLPREVALQVEKGEVIDFLSEVKAGDLAFFENTEGKIVHVGIMLNSHQVIHAFGHVKIEAIDYQGIISSQSGEYTHKLRVIKRLL